jgi:hypothetical protein
VAKNGEINKGILSKSKNHQSSIKTGDDKFADPDDVYPVFTEWQNHEEENLRKNDIYACNSREKGYIKFQIQEWTNTSAWAKNTFQPAFVIWWMSISPTA